jgi:hypothetical protein
MLYMYVYDKKFRETYAPGRFLVIHSDTGDEHPATYEHAEYTKEFCVKHGIEFVHLTADMGFHSPSWQSLRAFYYLKKAVGSKAFPKTCTDRLKIQPIYRFLEQWLGDNYDTRVGRKKGMYDFAEKHGKIRMLIGIAKGEEKRMADPLAEKAKWRRETINMEYPLVTLGLDRSACQKYIQGIGHRVPLPSNCVICPFMGEVELLWLYRNMPDDYEDWVNIERTKLDANLHMEDRNLGVWGKKTLPEVLAKAIEKHGHMSADALDDYKMSHGHCVMSKY